MSRAYVLIPLFFGSCSLSALSHWAGSQGGEIGTWITGFTWLIFITAMAIAIFADTAVARICHLPDLEVLYFFLFFGVMAYLLGGVIALCV
ncbi:MAG: hypothetical protein ACM37W_17440 [Actinomycetota bacterium]